MTTRAVRRRLLAVIAAIAVAAGLAIAVPASGAPGGAPEVPTGLTVDDRTDPLGVTGEPAFAWFPQDRDPGEVQTAYHVQVVDGAGDTVWDSGKVASSDQSHVKYTGTALEHGAGYSWRVRTWDRSDRSSPWSEPASFETGIGDDDWEDAAWIRRAPGGPGPMTLVDGRVNVRGGDVTLARLDESPADGAVEMTIRPISGGAGIVFRATDRRNGYMWQVSPGVGLRLHEQVNGRHTRLADVPLTIEAGQDYRVRVEFDGTLIRTFVDGVVVDERTHDRYAAGGIGVREASNETAEFDDVVIEDAAGAVVFSDDFSGDLSSWENERTDRMADEWTLARTEVDLADAEVTRARAYVAGSHTWELTVEGERADRGQSFSYPGEGYYQVSDVTDLVRGHDRVTLAATLHWYSSGQGRPAGEPGLLAKVVVDYADGTRQVVTTNDGWRVSDGPYVFTGTRNGEGEYIEHLDARRVQHGWQRTGFDDTGWDPAVVLGEHPVNPFTSLTSQESRIVEEVVTAEQILVADDGTVVADFGTVIPARPQIRFDAGVDGRTVNVRAGFNLGDDGRVLTSTLRTQGTNMIYPYTQVDGAQDFRAFTHLAFRYLEIPGADEDIEAADVTAVVVHADVPDGREAAFTSSDATLNDVWDLLTRSAIYSVQEAFVDTPTREKAQFLGDTANISYATMAAFGERDMTRQAIREFLNSADRYWSAGDDRGRYNAVYPNGDGKRDIPDYSLMFVDWVKRYHDVTGDDTLLAEAYPYLLDTAGYVRRHIPDDGPTAGLVTRLSGGSGAYQYGIIDWPEPGRFGYDMDAAARTAINAQSVDVFRDVAALGEALGRSADEVDTLRADADALADRMNETLRRADGVYVDGLLADGSQSTHAGQHSTSYAIAFGVAPQSDRPALAEYLAGLGMKQGPMTVHRLVEALGLAERPDAVVDLMTNPDDLGWADILSQDATFTWEAWTLDEGSNHSQSHGWSSQALTDVQEILLGVRTTSPGAATVDIAPPEAGLRSASGSVPTQRGDVAVDWRRAPTGTITSVSVPVNVTATVRLPVVDGRTYRPTGRGTAEYLGVEDGRAVFEVGSGSVRFVPVPDA